MKKDWITPQLQVLTRGQRQESVLSFCKGGFPSPNGPGSISSHCYSGNPMGPCSAIDVGGS